MPYLDEKDVSFGMDNAELHSIIHFQTHLILTWFDMMNYNCTITKVYVRVIKVNGRYYALLSN